MISFMLDGKMRLRGGMLLLWEFYYILLAIFLLNRILRCYLYNKVATNH